MRSQDPNELVQTLPDGDLETLVGVQLLSLTVDVDALANWGYGVPVDLVMFPLDTEFPLLYRHAKLLDKHPVRVSIPVRPEIFKAVKVAKALRFTVKLEVGQPAPAAIAAMQSVLDFYLHHTSVSQPVEFFHTSLMSFGGGGGGGGMRGGRWNTIIAEMFGNSVGTSMDFPNLYRKARNGTPEQYTAIWSRNVRAAREAGMQVGVIAIPNQGTLQVGAERFYAYFVDELGVTDFQINTSFSGGERNEAKQRASSTWMGSVSSALIWPRCGWSAVMSRASDSARSIN